MQKAERVSKKFPYYFLERNHNKKSFQSKFKPQWQKAVSETGHTVLTENNRRLHKNQVSNPINFQPSSSRGGYLSPKRKQKRGDDGKFRTGFYEEEDILEVTPVEILPRETTPLVRKSDSPKEGEKEKEPADPEEREVISPSIFVPSAEEGELNESGTGNNVSPKFCTQGGGVTTEQNDFEMRAVNTENSRRISKRLQTAKRPEFYGAMIYW